MLLRTIALIALLLCGPAQAQMSQVGGTAKPYGLFLAGFADNVNCNATGDTAITITSPTTNYKIQSIQVQGISGAWSSAQIGLFTGASQGGTTISSQAAISTINNANAATSSSLFTTAQALTNYFLNNTTLFLNVGSAQGAACVINYYIYAFAMP
jgi:hypothetical protein